MSVITIGGRTMKVSPGQEEIYSSEQWSLHSTPVSPCGKYQNYKLYLDNRKAPKRVWYLPVKVEKRVLCKSSELDKLEKYYPQMAKWVEKAVAGDIGPMPQIAHRVEKVRAKKIEPSDIVLRYGEQIIHILKSAWDDGWPLSIYGQTKKAGRYAPKIVGTQLSISQKHAEEAIVCLIEQGRIETAVFSKVTKLKGLRPTNRNQGVQHGKG